VQNRLARTVECADGPDVDHRTQILFGDPAETITKYAEAHRARLVLMTTGRVGLRKYVLGGVTEAVVRRSRCPVCTLDPNGHTLLPAPDAADPDAADPDAADSTLPEIGLPAAGDRSCRRPSRSTGFRPETSHPTVLWRSGAPESDPGAPLLQTPLCFQRIPLLIHPRPDGHPASWLRKTKRNSFSTRPAKSLSKKDR